MAPGQVARAEVLILLSVTMTTCLKMDEHHEFRTANTPEPSIHGPWTGLGIRLTMRDLTTAFGDATQAWGLSILPKALNMQPRDHGLRP